VGDAFAVTDPTRTPGPPRSPRHVKAAQRFLRALEGTGDLPRSDDPLERLFRDALPAVRLELGEVEGDDPTGRLLADVPAAVAALRERRRVTVETPPADPITEPAREILFTSNVLLGLPLAPEHHAALAELPADVAQVVRAASATEQRHWFDHPIPIGVEPEANELVQGLRGLDEAAAAEGADRLTVVLSVSVTHPALREIARPYVEATLGLVPPLRTLDVVVVSEDDARGLVSQVLRPAIERWAPGTQNDARTLDVVGVDGAYGRHYSFLKAVAALWHVFVDPRVRATFKFDLDQAFPQRELLAETGRMALEHLANPDWGAMGRDGRNRPIELGMLAGALVNERDIGRGLFTPDVPIPPAPSRPSEALFYPVLPQAVSTRAEMQARDDDGPIERIHVTGGTTGIRVDALRRHRPFTPSWIGRAEDQAYMLSALGGAAPRLAYLHAPGLIMRHDKEAFAGDAIAAAHVGKLIGDDVRILVFSAYADAAASDAAASDRRTPAGPDGGLDRAAIGRLLDPFTGGFVSDVPVSLVLARLAMRTLRMLADGEIDDGRRYALDGARRLAEVLDATAEPDRVAERLAGERRAWDAVYDALDALEIGLAAGDERARALQARATAIIDACRISVTRPAPD
jgi:hypothetical protein